MNKDLQKSALGITLNGNRAAFLSGVLHEPVEKRMLEGNERFFLHTGGALAFLKPLYYIYRNVRLPAHDALFKKQGLRHDITVLSPGMLRSREAIRTIGHLHARNGTHGRPSELYQVLSGKAFFYLQHPTRRKAICIQANAGDAIYIPGTFGHITINASLRKPLTIANIFIRKKLRSDYSFFKKTNGPALFPLWKNNRIIFQKNNLLPTYALERIKASAKLVPAPVRNDLTLYDQYISDPESFAFLAGKSKNIGI